jgi:hypothetical protein
MNETNYWKWKFRADVFDIIIKIIFGLIMIGLMHSCTEAVKDGNTKININSESIKDNQ